MSQFSFTKPKPRIAPWLAALVVLAVFGYALQQSWQKQSDIPAFVLPAADLPAGKGIYQERFVLGKAQNFVHSPTVTQLPGGDLLAAWFEGSREGAADVQIMHSRFLASENRWTAPTSLMTRQTTAEGVGRHIRKLGNPVLVSSPTGKVFLFYVSVSYGGWGGSAINWVASSDSATTWSQPKRLITTPFLNVSTLVRNPAVLHDNGVIGLPVYHEFLGKFPEYLLISNEGVVLDKIRMNDGDESLQPSVSPIDTSRALAVLRYSGNGPPKAMGQMTQDRGASWSKPVPMPISNPNSSLGSIATGLTQWPLLVAANDTEDGRYRLRMYLTDADMKTWKLIHAADASPNEDGKPYDLRQDPNYMKNLVGKVSKAIDEESIQVVTNRVCKGGNACELQYEYPTLIRSSDGLFHLLYAWNDMLIKHVTFDQAWIQQHAARP